MIEIKKVKIKAILIFILVFQFLFIGFSVDSFSKKSSTAKKKKSIKVPVKVIVKDTSLALCIKYKNYLLGSKYKFSVHVVEVDLINPNCEIAVLKAKNKAYELEKLHNMINTFDSLSNYKVLAAINANFWRAYSFRPIGPTIVNGEVVELKTHKQWTSAFFDRFSRPYINNFYISGSIKDNTGNILEISTVNRREDSTGIVLYNSFAGDTIPYINSRTMAKALSEALKDTVFIDSTEISFDTLAFQQELEITKRAATVEYSLRKIMLKYLDSPAVNKDVPCVVIGFDSGTVAVPKNGCILSFGNDFQSTLIPKIRDTLTLRYSTNVDDSIIFMNSVSGTPRLVRNGKAKHEAYEEGSRGRRFINRALPRTAIGTDKSHQKIFLVAVEPSYRRERRLGASLVNMAWIMKQIGAYDAMNLDGGGSTAMVINNKNVVYHYKPEASRKIAVALAVILKGKPLKDLFKNSE